MSIISNNKNNRRREAEKYLAAWREALARREAAENRMDTEDADAIMDAVTVLLANHDPMTASELSAAVGGAVSAHELAGNLPYVGKGGYKGDGVSRYSKLRTADRHVVSHTRSVTHKFAEVDEDGNLIPNGHTMTSTEKRTYYTVREGQRKRW